MWMHRAVQQGLAIAQNHLAFMYFSGQGVAEDYTFALAWWNFASAKGNEQARFAKEALRKIMTAAQIAEAQVLSRELE